MLLFTGPPWIQKAMPESKRKQTKAKELDMSYNDYDILTNEIVAGGGGIAANKKVERTNGENVKRSRTRTKKVKSSLTIEFVLAFIEAVLKRRHCVTIKHVPALFIFRWTSIVPAFYIRMEQVQKFYHRHCFREVTELVSIVFLLT